MEAPQKLRLSIIFVVKDDLEGYFYTQPSLREAVRQGQGSVEVILVDSSDEPLQALATDFVYIPMEPSGIFPAMELGRASAQGQYVCYVNSGDRLNVEAVISLVFGPLCQANGSDWYCTNTLHEGSRVEAPLPLAVVRLGEHFCSHQGLIHRARDGAFDLSFKCVADLVQMNDLLKKYGEPCYISCYIVDCARMNVAHSRRSRQAYEVFRFMFRQKNYSGPLLRLLMKFDNYKYLDQKVEY